MKHIKAKSGMSRLWGVLSLLVVLIALSSCISGNRMVRAIPFTEKNKSMPDPDRINVWPLLYSNAGSTTVMWPLMDFDDEGFAIRPLIAMDGDEGSLLWPLSGWDAKDGDGWFLNSYWYDETFGIFPITHVEKDWGFFLTSYWNEKAFGVFPVMYADDNKGYFLNSYWNKDAFGMFPLMHLEEDRGFFLNSFWNDKGWGVLPISYVRHDESAGYIGPAYWTDDSFGIFPVMYNSDEWGYALNTYWNKDGWGVFPLSYVENDGSGGYVGPVYWGDDVFGIFPVMYNEGERGYALNTYWNEDGWGVFPLSYMKYDGSGGYVGPVNWGEDRFGIFPVMYKDKDWGYALNTYWNDEGWGVFPLSYAKYDGSGGYVGPVYWGEDIFGIFPFMHKAKDWGYALNTYWNDEGWGVFPLSYAKYDGSGGYVGPVYWGDDLFGIFPIMSVNNTLSYAGPAWWTDDAGGLFPLYHFYDKGTHLEHRLLFALGALENAPDYHKSWLAPLWYADIRKDDYLFATLLGGAYGDEKKDGHWLPLWWHESEGDTTFDLLPLVYSKRSPEKTQFASPLAIYNREGTDSNLWAFPTWFSKTTATDSQQNLWPIYHNRESGAESTSWLFPFYFQDSDADSYSLFTLLGNYNKSPGKKNLNIYPLWWSSEENLTTSETLLPFYHYRNDTGKKSLITPLGGYGWDDQGTSRFLNVMGPLYHHHETEDKSFELTAFAWPLYTHLRDKETTRDIVPLLYHRTETPDVTNINMLAYLCQIQLEKDSTSWMAFPFASSSNRAKMPNVLYHANMFHFYEHGDTKVTRITPFYQRTVKGDRTSSYLFPFYRSVQTPDKYDLDYLLFLGDYKKDATGTSGRLWPFASVSRQPNRPDPLYYTSLFSYHKYADSRSWWFTPLIGQYSEGGKSTGWVFPAAWWNSNDKGDFDLRYLLGLGHVKKEENTLKRSYLQPLYYYNTDGATSDFYAPFYFGHYGKSANGTSGRLWPFAAVSREPRRPDPLYYASLFSYHKHGDRKNWWFTPLIGENTVGGKSSGWVFPAAWWNYDDKGDFDLQYLAGLGHVRRKNHKLTRSYLQPLYDYIADGDTTDFYAPFYLGHFGSSDEGTSGRFWPLAAVSSQPRRPDPLYYASLFSYHSHADHRSWWFTPLVGHNAEKGRSFTWAFPITSWWHHNDKGDLNLRYLFGWGNLKYKNHRFARSSLVPVYDYTVNGDEHNFDTLFYLANFNKTNEGASGRLWPFAAISHQPSRPDVLYNLSLFSYHGYAGKSTWWATPLIGRTADKDKSLAWVLPLTWWTTDNRKNELDIRYLLGLGNLKYKNDRFARNSLFLLYSVQNNYNSPDHEMHLFTWNSHDRGYKFGLFPLLGMEADSEGDRDTFRLSVLCGLGAEYKSWSTSKASGSDYHYLFISGGKSSRYVEGEVPKTGEVKALSSSYDYLFPVFYKQKKVNRSWKPGVMTDDEKEVLGQWWIDVHAGKTPKVSNEDIAELLVAKGFPVSSSKTATLKKEVARFAEKGCFDQKDSTFASLIYWSNENARGKHWNFLFWFIYYTLDRKEDTSTFRIMHSLYSSKRAGNKVSRTFFPFFVWDNEGEASTFSFLWRVWRRTKDKDGNTSGYIFFIPWGKK